jgi:phospholipase/carboxylesterase
VVFQSHGRLDPLLPFESAVALRGLLEEGGAQVDFVAFDGAHEIPPLVVDRLASFLRARFSRSPASST